MTEKKNEKEGKKTAPQKSEKTPSITEKVTPLEKKELAKIELGKGLKIYDVIKYPLITEKAVNIIETENKIVFVVDGKASRSDVKKAVEALYGVKVDKVNILRDMTGRKRAIVRLNKAFKAEDLATKLGVL